MLATMVTSILQKRSQRPALARTRFIPQKFSAPIVTFCEVLDRESSGFFPHSRSFLWRLVVEFTYFGNSGPGWACLICSGLWRRQEAEGRVLRERVCAGHAVAGCACFLREPRTVVITAGVTEREVEVGRKPLPGESCSTGGSKRGQG